MGKTLCLPHCPPLCPLCPLCVRGIQENAVKPTEPDNQSFRHSFVVVVASEQQLATQANKVRAPLIANMYANEMGQQYL